jgi:GT2 family glycosyltransferase
VTGVFDRRTTVVVATRDRSETLGRTLARLGALPERPAVIVVDDASADGTADAVRVRYPGVRLLTLERNHGPAARNVGVHAAATPYVAFSDDDSWWASRALGRAADILDAHPDVALVAARILVGPEERLDDTSAAMARSPLPSPNGLPGRPILGFVACGVVVRRRAFLDVGGFSDVVATGGEEDLLALDLAAARWRLLYAADVVAHHHPPTRDNADGRRRGLLRSRVQTAWLRRPLSVALRETATTVTLAIGDRPARHALLDVGRGLPAVVRARRPLPREIEEQRELLDRTQAEGRDALRAMHADAGNAA